MGLRWQPLKALRKMSVKILGVTMIGEGTLPDYNSFCRQNHLPPRAASSAAKHAASLGYSFVDIINVSVLSCGNEIDRLRPMGIMVFHGSCGELISASLALWAAFFAKYPNDPITEESRPIFLELGYKDLLDDPLRNWYI